MPTDAVTVTLSRDEAKQFVDDLRRLDAYVIAQSAGGIAPSKRRAEVRRKLLEALNALQRRFSGEGSS